MLEQLKKRREDLVEYEMRDLSPREVKDLRTLLGLNQEEFSAKFGISIDIIGAWEQGRTKPRGLAKAFLNLLRFHLDRRD